MDPQDPQLVQRITDEVIAALQRRLVDGVDDAAGGGATAGAGGGAGRGASGSAGGRAEIHAPAGVCTGDYSKFPELAGRTHGRSPWAFSPGVAEHQGNGNPAEAKAHGLSPWAFSPGVAEHQGNGNPAETKAHGLSPWVSSDSPATPALGPTLTGLITQRQLQEALDRGSGVAVSRHARLTPLARDLAKQVGERIRYVEPDAAAAAAGSETRVHPLPWLWWIEGHCPFVASYTAERRRELLPVGAERTAAGLSDFVGRLAEAVGSERARGGAVFVPNAARAMCYLNRRHELRAVLGTCLEAVDQGITELGMNVLVLEYPYKKPDAMRAMLDRFLATTPKPPPQIAADL